MKILVTGASGQLGSYVMDHMQNDTDVAGVDICESERESHRQLVGRVDIRDMEAMRKACRDADAVVHLAAQVSVVKSIEDPLWDLDINVAGTVTTLRAAQEEEVPLFVYISTAAVYGDPLRIPIDEDHPADPISFYGVSKLSSEHYVRAFSRSFGLDHIIVRPFNLYSPRADPGSPYSGVITRFVENAKDGKRLIIEGDGEQTRDFIHARDTARMIALCLRSDVRNVTLNCASGRGISINELASTVADVCPRQVDIGYGPPRTGDIRHSLGDPSRAMELMGFEPTTSLAEGLSSFFED